MGATRAIVPRMGWYSTIGQARQNGLCPISFAFRPPSLRPNKATSFERVKSTRGRTFPGAGFVSYASSRSLSLSKRGDLHRSNGSSREGGFDKLSQRGDVCWGQKKTGPPTWRTGRWPWPGYLGPGSARASWPACVPLCNPGRYRAAKRHRLSLRFGPRGRRPGR